MALDLYLVSHQCILLYLPAKVILFRLSSKVSNERLKEIVFVCHNASIFFATCMSTETHLSISTLTQYAYEVRQQKPLLDEEHYYWIVLSTLPLLIHLYIPYSTSYTLT